MNIHNRIFYCCTVDIDGIKGNRRLCCRYQFNFLDGQACGYATSFETNLGFTYKLTKVGRKRKENYIYIRLVALQDGKHHES